MAGLFGRFKRRGEALGASAGHAGAQGTLWDAAPLATATAMSGDAAHTHAAAASTAAPEEDA